jgi:signal transduction histidine kinase
VTEGRAKPGSELESRVSELVALNELAIAVSSTLDLEELLDRALTAVVGRLPFDRALVLLIDGNELSGGRSVGGGIEADRLVRDIRLALGDERSTLVQLARSDGPMVFRSVGEDPHEPNRELAHALGVDSFLGTPLVTKGRTVGVLAVDNQLSGRDVERSMGPLLYTVGTLLAAAIENAQLYAQIEEQNRELEARVARRTAQLAEATEAAQAARASAESASATKSQFLANVSHELRTPLTSILGFTKLVRKRLDDVVLPALPVEPASAPRATYVVGARGTVERAVLETPSEPKLERAVRQIRENLEIIVAEGDRLTALINEVLDLEKIEAGKMEFHSEPVDLGEVVEQATAATAALFETTGLELRRDIAPGLPPVSGDRHRLVQVVINLLSNAVKFTPAGSISIHVTGAADDVTVSVADTGIGIPPADRDRVFDQFAQSGDTLSDTPRGTGLGLAICREIVERHGGRIWLESELGAGSTFSFSVPVAVREPQPEPIPSA